MGAPQVTIETITVTRPLKVIAFTCCAFTVILMVAATSTSDWMSTPGWREGLFSQCVEARGVTPVPFADTRPEGDEGKEPGCYAGRGKSYIRGAAALVIIGLFTDFFGTFLTCLGLRSTDPNKKYKYYRVGIYALIVAIIALLLAAIIYPVQFSKDLQEEDVTHPLDGANWIEGNKISDGDLDDDGLDDNVDPDDDNDGIPDSEDKDDDNDGIPDTEDGIDTDGDGIQNANDLDDDGDGVNDDVDTDDDNDGIEDDQDIDDDNDGNQADEDEEDEVAPGPTDEADTDADDDGIDDDEDTDDDDDGILDVNDPDDDGDGINDVDEEEVEEDEDEEDEDGEEGEDGEDGDDEEEEDDGIPARVFSFGFGYGATWGSIVLIFASVVLLICDRESEEIYYKEKQVEEDEEEEGGDA